MKILYGVVGEGMGHAMRSRVVLQHLVDSGHDVHVMASQRAVDYLSTHLASVHRIHGLHIVYADNRARWGKTLWSNLVAGTLALPGQVRAYFDLIDEFRPEVVVSDFESWTHLYAKTHGLRVFSIDNIQMLNRCAHPKSVVNIDRLGFETARALVKAKLPRADRYLITTFYYPRIKKKRTNLYPPILRPEVLSAVPSEGEHLLVYQTAEGNDSLAAALAASEMECRIYGMRRGIREDEVEGKLRYRPFSETGFIDDLRTARAVVAGGGFTLMSEAVYLHKPVLAMPVAGQFEQVLNAAYLEREGYGRHASVLDEATLSEFLRDVPGCKRKLAKYSQDGNRLLLDALEHLLDSAAAGV